MKLTIDCPHGYYADRMRIMCRKTGNVCGHQYYKRCKGWWVLTEHAARCPLRKEN